MNETQALARFVAQTQFTDLPRRLVDNLKIAVLDTFGAGFVGALQPWAQRIVAVVRALPPAVPVLFAVWALAGFYGSLGPALTGALLHSTSVVYGRLGLFILAGVAAGSVLAFHRTEPRPVLYLSIGALAAGVAVTLAAVSADSAVDCCSSSCCRTIR